MSQDGVLASSSQCGISGDPCQITSRYCGNNYLLIPLIQRLLLYVNQLELVVQDVEHSGSTPQPRICAEHVVDCSVDELAIDGWRQPAIGLGANLINGNDLIDQPATRTATKPEFVGQTSQRCPCVDPGPNISMCLTRVGRFLRCSVHAARRRGGPVPYSRFARRRRRRTRRAHRPFQTDPPARVLLADYEHPYDHTITAKDMYARREDDRLARKQRPENRVRWVFFSVDVALTPLQFYSFLTRSRSRSRSKTDPSLDHESTIPELVHDYPHNTSHSRQSSGSVREDKSSKPSAYRPLSTTTTATNTTIMPPTPKPRRTPAPYAEVPPHHNENTSRPSTPSRGPSNTRKKLHNIFGIPLTGPRRSGSRKSSISSTRPSTPDLHSAPPLPDPGSSHDSTPSRRNNAPPPLDFHRSSSPSLRSRSKQSTFDSVESSTSTSAPRDHQFKSQKLFLGKQTQPLLAWNADNVISARPHRIVPF